MGPDLVYKFEMICSRKTDVIERKPNMGGTDGHTTWFKLNS